MAIERKKKKNRAHGNEKKVDFEEEAQELPIVDLQEVTKPKPLEHVQSKLKPLQSLPLLLERRMGNHSGHWPSGEELGQKLS